MLDEIRSVFTAHLPQELPLEGRRESAVLLLLYPLADAHCVVFQLRTYQVAHHRGEISLPGGARDPGDATLADTALRETHEEIAVPPESIEIFGRLDDIYTRSSNYRVTPFVGALREGAAATASAYAVREVSELLWVPLGHLLSEESRAWKVVDEDGVPTATAAFQHGEHLIWGATARIVTQFVDLLSVAPARARATWR
jgi:8-oxo-dGTP pyrophosphatase MutT (NUDIX family)